MSVISSATLSFFDESYILTVIKLVLYLHVCADPTPAESMVAVKSAPDPAPTESMAAVESAADPAPTESMAAVGPAAAEPLHSIVDFAAAGAAPTETS
jgi:hypothetical protein